MATVNTVTLLSSASVPRLLEPRVAAHIERGRVAMRRLEEMFAKHPTLQSQEVCSTLFDKCRFSNRVVVVTVRELGSVTVVVVTVGVAMRRLEEIFAKYPTLQSQEVCYF